MFCIDFFCLHTIVHYLSIMVFLCLLIYVNVMLVRLTLGNKGSLLTYLYRGDFVRGILSRGDFVLDSALVTKG